MSSDAKNSSLSSLSSSKNQTVIPSTIPIDQDFIENLRIARQQYILSEEEIENVEDLRKCIEKCIDRNKSYGYGISIKKEDVEFGETYFGKLTLYDANINSYDCISLNNQGEYLCKKISPKSKT
jgi:hypothetical protein